MMGGRKRIDWQAVLELISLCSIAASINVLAVMLLAKKLGIGIIGAALIVLLLAIVFALFFEKLWR